MDKRQVAETYFTITLINIRFGYNNAITVCLFLYRKKSSEQGGTESGNEGSGTKRPKSDICVSRIRLWSTN